MSFNSWLTVLFIQNVSYLMELIFNIKANVVVKTDKILIYLPNFSYPGRVFTVCYGAQVISIFISIILTTPPSLETKRETNIIWRKIKIIIIIILSTYLSYLFRMVMMLTFINNGMPMHIIHDSSYYFITLISFIIILYAIKNILPEFIVSLHYIRYCISSKKIHNSLTENIKTKKKSNLIKELAVQSKELYYPLFGTLTCTLMLYNISIFLSVYGYHLFYITINPYMMLLPLLLAIILLISRYLLDLAKNLTKLNLIFSLLFISLIICLSFLSSILVNYLVRDILNSITITIYFSSVIFIYYFFHNEVKYYLLITRL